MNVATQRTVYKETDQGASTPDCQDCSKCALALTLGAKLLSGARRVTVHGEPIEVKASIHTLGGFSAHAGQSGLIEWVGNYCKMPKSQRIILTHGEDAPRAALRDQLEARFGVRAECPMRGDVLLAKLP